MSSMYYRVTHEPPPAPTYGFRRVDGEELNLILSRVTRPRSSNHRDDKSGDNVPETEVRPGTASRLRPKSAPPRRRGKRMSDKDVQKLIRRLQKPTLSFKLGREDFTSTPNSTSGYGQITRPKGPENTQNKKLEKLCRPTTATMAKTVGSCHLCLANESKTEASAFDYDYADDRSLPPEEVDAITERVRCPTQSSRPHSRLCRRSYRGNSPDPAMKQDPMLPLISGLSRSKTVAEIVDRLQPTKRQRNTPSATRITTY